ncbi:hypothetical protein [Haloarcula rubripromontorii]|uniref:Uncharacterized protein n=1 Tax=Haloarcula rubripromontorii TaxID=1705562 RepID=A0A0M9AHZ6_9EURY|nr:hypothetical protein [Haloarcula rubripromontorii]KOX92447.1 hypothetical protein AMS69_13920 [Haloarcula rubripromontorii]
MKSGAGSPFEDDFDVDDDAEGNETGEEAKQADQIDTETQVIETANQDTEALPFKYRRDSVQDERSHANFFLRDEAESRVEEIVDTMDDIFASESVYKIDVCEAIVLAANDESRTVEDELRKMGYGMK